MFVTHLITFLTIGSIVYGTFEILPITSDYVPSVTKTVYLLMRESSSDNNQADVIEAFKYSSRYQNDNQA